MMRLEFGLRGSADREIIHVEVIIKISSLSSRGRLDIEFE